MQKLPTACQHHVHGSCCLGRKFPPYVDLWHGSSDRLGRHHNTEQNKYVNSPGIDKETLRAPIHSDEDKVPLNSALTLRRLAHQNCVVTPQPCNWIMLGDEQSRQRRCPKRIGFRAHRNHNGKNSKDCRINRVYGTNRGILNFGANESSSA
jgi:hypothetical protein